MNVAEAVIHRIFDFVTHRENRRLQPGTGPYSVPFRGGLFGLDDAAAIGDRLESQAADVLWLGTNPCVPASLEYVISDAPAGNDFPDFQRQLASGFFGSRRWDGSGSAIPDWNPLQAPTAVWRVYRDALAAVFDLDAVAMANCVPWGSQSLRDLVRQVRAVDPGLLDRMLAFVDVMTGEMVTALRPRLIVVPFSLAEVDRVYPLWLSRSRATEIVEHGFDTESGRFRYFTGVCSRGAVAVSTLWLRHPASLKITTASRRQVTKRLSKAMRNVTRRG